MREYTVNAHFTLELMRGAAEPVAAVLPERHHGNANIAGGSSPFVINNIWS